MDNCQLLVPEAAFETRDPFFEDLIFVIEIRDIGCDEVELDGLLARSSCLVPNAGDNICKPAQVSARSERIGLPLRPEVDACKSRRRPYILFLNQPRHNRA